MAFFDFFLCFIHYYNSHCIHSFSSSLLDQCFIFEFNFKHHRLDLPRFKINFEQFGWFNFALKFFIFV